MLWRFRHHVAMIYYRWNFFQYLFCISINQLSLVLIIHLVGYNLNLARIRLRHRSFVNCTGRGKSLSRCSNLNSYNLDLSTTLRSVSISLRTSDLSDPCEPPQRAYRTLFEAGYLLISSQTLMCKFLLPITYSNA